MRFGIDISEYQKSLDFSKLPGEGVEFIMLRSSWTGYGSARNIVKDEAFESFYNKAKTLGIPVGAYHYSCADSYQEGQREARFMWENCIKGRVFEYPIVLDMENEKWQGNCSRSRLTDAFFGFFDYMSEKGCYVTLYASTYWLEQKFDTERIKAVDKWAADWGHNPPDVYNLGLWQFGGETNLIRGTRIAGMTIDQNYAFRDYPEIMHRRGFNGCTTETTEPPQTTTPTKSHETLQKGSEGLSVRVWQAAAGVEVDGIFGADTERAVKDWQRSHGLVPDGIVGVNSWSKLLQML